MRNILRFLPWLAVLIASAAAAAPARPNVLFIAVDDLRVSLGCYGDPLTLTPNLDRFAAGARVFNRAYTLQAVCGPARTAMLTGRLPDHNRSWHNRNLFRATNPDSVTLPQLFMQHGYFTQAMGKIFSGDERELDPASWSVPEILRQDGWRNYALPRGEAPGKQAPWEAADVPDEGYSDGKLAALAVETLGRLKAEAKPFFLAVGFHRPHLPLVAPAKYFDLYPFDSIQLPTEPADDEADIPAPARNGSVPGYALTTTPDQRRAAIRGYLATVSYMDAQAGRVLDALKRLKLEENTIVIFAADHGWHLGEHGLWHKRSLFEESARVPFLVAAPGAKGNGQRSASLVELLDVYPTLCDLAGVPAPAGLQGKSLRPVLNNPLASFHEGAFTQARRGAKAEHWGRSVRTARWRCTEWDEGRNGIELYDHAADPHEFTNLANDPKHATVLKELRALLAAKLPPIAK